MHARFAPVSHRFVYPVYTYVIDLDELEELDREVRWFGYNRFNLAAIHDRHYLRGSGSIKQRLLALLAEKGCADGIERVEMVTMARFLGYCFNPVTFFYCYGADGAIRCHAAEVNNTFGERHFYVLNEPLPEESPGNHLYRHAKQFYVSPFNDRRGYYELSFSALNENLRIGVTLFRDEMKIMTAWLQGAGMELNSRNMWKTALRYPLTAALSFSRICYQAGKLYFRKRLRFYPKPGTEHPMTIGRNPPSLTDTLGMRAMAGVLENIREGVLDLQMPDGRVMRYPAAAQGEVQRQITVKDYALFRRVLKGGDVGFGESYVRGEWSTPDLTALLRFFITNIPAVKGPLARRGVFSVWRNRYVHWRRRNTKVNSLRNIRDHYDLGNDFYRLFLDNETMLYSCGIFCDEKASLADAQREKVHEIIRRAEIDKSHHVLEIGCGWGGFALEAARYCGCRVTGITLSREQLRYAREQAAEAQLEHLVTFELCDYRDMQGQFDRIVSIEMLEAVGHEFYGTFFAACDRLLKSGGKVVIQTITIPDERFKNYQRNPDWIQLYIFPGGELPSVAALDESIHRYSKLTIAAQESIGKHYAVTLRRWRESFNRQSEQLARMGYDEYFQRKWNYYFSYCEAGFAEAYIDDLILTLERG